MSNHSVLNNLELGSRLGVICMRVGEAFVLCLIVFFIPYLTPLRESAIPLALILYTFVRAHEVAYGYADSRGIRYRRYFQWHAVTWSQVESITKDSRIVIVVNLGKGWFFNRKIMFLENPPVGELLKKSSVFERVRDAWIDGRSAG